MRFKRITAAFDDDARARLCQSSGSEHSANNSVTDLSDLVDSFLAGDDDIDDDRGKSSSENEGRDHRIDDESTEFQEMDRRFYETDSDDTKGMLMDLIGVGADDDDKLVIRSEVETACRNLENCSPEHYKRSLMTLLRQLGFDAGLCKSRWEKTGRYPAGEYEYIDVLISGNRYIVEVSFGAEFTIARPTQAYKSLLEVIPKITVMKPNELKKAVRLMCGAMRASLKTREMLVSPWRKNGYMQMKWFGSYKRTTNAPPSMWTAVEGDGGMMSSFVGFEYSSRAVVGGGGKDDNCRKEVGKMVHVVGNLKALMLSGM